MAVKSLNARNGISVGVAPNEIIGANGDITLVAGTTTLAPIKFIAGTNLTAAAAGSMEYDGSVLYLTITGNIRKSIAYLDSNITGNAANITGTLAVAQGGTGATSNTGTAGSNVLSNTPTITTPVIDVINASSVSLSTAALYGNLTTGTLTIGGALTTGTINIATGSDTAKVVNIGTTSTITSITGVVKLPTLGSDHLLYTTTGGEIVAASAANIVAEIGATAVTNATNATNATNTTHIAGGAANSIPYQTGAGVTAFLAQGTGVLQETAGAPAWTTTPTLTGTNFTGIPNAALTNSSVTVGSTAIALGASATTIVGLTSVTSTTFVGALTGNATTATTATHVAGGAAGSLVYQTGAGATGFVAAVAAGSILVSNGTSSAPVYSATPSITTSLTVPLIQGTGGAGGTITIRGGTDTAGTIALNAATINSAAATLGLFATPTSITLGAAATTVNIGAATGTTNIKNSLVVDGDLTVSGTTTTMNTATILVEDKNIELGNVGSPSDTTADGGGITLKGTSDKTILWDNANDNWSFNQSVNISTGLVYKINNVSVLSATALGSSVVGSSLTSVGTLTSLTTSGQITSTVSTGTAPFVVSSTTQVANLNAATAGSATTATTATHIAGGAVGQLHYQTGSGATGFVAVGSAGQLLQSAGSAIPVYTTATYPTTAGTAGKILRSDGTNILSSTATFADTYAASVLLYSNGANTVQGLATANNGVLVTSGSGVPSISSTLPAALSIPGLLVSTSASVSAAGTTQGTGTALTSDMNVATTVASGTGVVLPTAAAGRKVVVVNKGANALLVYPATGAAIDALSANVAISVPVNGRMEFNASSATQWYSTVNEVVSTSALSGTISNAQLANSTVTVGSTAIALGASATTLAGLTSVTSTTFVGNLTGTASNVTTNANLTGPITSSGNATSVTNNAITNAMLAQMATLTIKGNNTGGTANAADLTVAQVNAILPVFTSALNGLVPLSGGGTTNFLRADGTWAVPGGGGTVTAVSIATANGVSGSSSGGSTPALTIVLGAITPTSVVASGSLTAGTGGVIAGSGTTTSDVFTAGAMHVLRAGAATTAAVTLVNLDTWPVATYRSAKYVIQVTDTVSGHVQIAEILLIRDNSNNVYVTEYGTIQSGSSLVTFTADYDGSANVRLRITPASTNSTQYKFSATIFNL